MNFEQLETAIAKADSPKAKAMLEAMRPAFQAVVEFDASFEDRITASKVARGEGPTKLRKAKRQEVAGYERDAVELERAQTEQFNHFERAEEIIGVLRAGLEHDLRFWGDMLKHFHPAELPLGQEYLSLKGKLLEEMDQFLAESGRARSPKARGTG